MAKKIFLFFFLAGVLYFPLTSSAAGLVPCGNEGQPACQFCHLFVVFDNVLDFVFRMVAVVGGLLFAIGGGMFLLAGDNAGQIETAKRLMKSVVIGLVIVYSSWLLLGLFFQSIGLADWTTAIYKNWWSNGLFNIDCPTS